ncbi:unnamed protein product [Anisakis simplex]|uniref:Uncharacterized protein n=1 Tax=Anisakis simplex TaxID=6269 RepID=A0A3P6NND9_ANISI|nr:unnamed protein product [Anisakis simplex]
MQSTKDSSEAAIGEYTQMECAADSAHLPLPTSDQNFNLTEVHSYVSDSTESCHSGAFSNRSNPPNESSCVLRFLLALSLFLTCNLSLFEFFLSLLVRDWLLDFYQNQFYRIANQIVTFSFGKNRIYILIVFLKLQTNEVIYIRFKFDQFTMIR